MTPREAQWQLETIAKQDEQEWRRTAQLASWVLGSLGWKGTADDLLGKTPDRSTWVKAFS